MSDIRKILKHTSYSDGGLTSGDPPTYQDRVMRIKHTSDSIVYNLDHAKDHFAELAAQLGKLQGVDRGCARQLAEKVCKYIDSIYGEIEEYK